MEVISESRVRPAYYFSWPDQEILDDRLLTLSCDEDTWLYKVEHPSFNGHFPMGSQNNYPTTPTSGGSVDSRTFTRRKHCSLRPSLDSVVESPLSNRSSLGLLSASKQLNETFPHNYTVTSASVTQEKTFSNFTASDKNYYPRRIFKLDSPFTNTAALEVNRFPINCNMERTRHDSESSDISVPQSLENFSSFDKNEVMTDSLVNFLGKQEVNCRPPTAFQDEKCMTDSLVSLPESNETHNTLDIMEKSEPMTDSMVNFLAPVNCRPPLGFEDNDMTNSLVNIDEKDILPSADMTNSVMDYLQNVKISSSAPLIKSTGSSESENIPPDNSDNVVQLASSCLEKLKASGESRHENNKLNSTYDLEENGDLNNGSDEMANIEFTNNVNIMRRREESGDIDGDLNITRPLNITFEKECNLIKDNSEQNLKTKALNNRDLNVSVELYDEMSELNLIKTHSKTNSTVVLNNTKLNGTFKKSSVNETLNSSRQIPLRYSTFNTTFTKLQPPKENSKLPCQTQRSLNTTFAKSTEGLEDDQTSSASDSSFSSGSTKPRSVDELRSIAQQQETSLAQYTSTPTGSSITSQNLSKLDLELSPIRMSLGSNRNNASRSANCSPVRSPYPRSTLPHPISRLQHPLTESRRHTLQASSLSNIARPQMTGMRVPQPVSRLSIPVKTASRPSTAPAPAPTAIPRPRASRLPMPRFRGSGIPGPKRGGLH